MVWQELVNSGQLTPSDFVRVTSTAAAQVYNIYPRKGVVAPGSDADVIIFDPSLDHTITAAAHHSAMDTNIYEGYRVRGKVGGALGLGGWLAPGVIVCHACTFPCLEYDVFTCCSCTCCCLPPNAGGDHHQPRPCGVARGQAQRDARQRPLCAHTHPRPAVPGLGQAARAPRGRGTLRWRARQAQQQRHAREGRAVSRRHGVSRRARCGAVVGRRRMHCHPAIALRCGLHHHVFVFYFPVKGVAL